MRRRFRLFSSDNERAGALGMTLANLVRTTETCVTVAIDSSVLYHA
jgi:hypothetical protein